MRLDVSLVSYPLIGGSRAWVVHSCVVDGVDAIPVLGCLRDGAGDAGADADVVGRLAYRAALVGLRVKAVDRCENGCCRHVELVESVAMGEA